MEETVRDAVFGNVGTLISFRVGAEDAEFLEKEFAPEFTANDLVNLAKYDIYLKLMIDGMASRPFSATTLPPFPRPEKSFRETVIRISRERYSTPKEKVEEKIAKWSGFGKETLESEAQQKKTVHKELFEAVCANCGKKIMLPFKPDNRRPVYCNDCLEKVRKGEIPPVNKVNQSVKNPQAPETKEYSQEASIKTIEKSQEKKNKSIEPNRAALRQAIKEILDRRQGR